MIISIEKGGRALKKKDINIITFYDTNHLKMQEKDTLRRPGDQILYILMFGITI